MRPENPTKVFKMTRSDDVIYNADGIGRILGFITDKTELIIDNENFIGSSFLLQVIDTFKNLVVSKIKIDIVKGW